MGSPPQLLRLGRFEIIAPLASGGMAELFLGRAAGVEGFEKIVVLKRVLPELARNSEIVTLFLDEARLAAQLQHSNIAQVYEVGVEEGNYFFAMEHVQGEDVRALLHAARKRKEKLPLDVALTIAIGLATGLHYAHEANGSDGRPLGIIHRDVSPSNVLVSYDGLVKVVDFGIAKAATRSHETQVGGLRGKYGYMSPEQCRRQPLDRRSDLFGIAIVLYEITTTSRLFEADNEYDAVKKTIDERIAPPSERQPGYPPELERIVMKGLERDPSRRYATAQELLLDLEAFARQEQRAVSSVTVARYMERNFGERIGAWRRAIAANVLPHDLTQPALTPPSLSPSTTLVSAERSTLKIGRSWRRLMIAGVGIAALVAALAWGAIQMIHHRDSPSGPRQVIAVLGLKNLSGRNEAAWLSMAASEMLSMEMGAGDQMRTIPGEAVAEMRLDLRLPDTDGFTPETLARIRSRGGVDLVLTGSYYALGVKGETIRLEVRLQSTTREETIAEVSESGLVAELPEVVARAGAHLRKDLGLRQVSGADAVALRVSLPVDPEAARLYAEGLQRLRKPDAIEARRLLEETVTLAPQNPLVHAALATALTSLGYDKRAAEEAETAFKLSSELPREERRAIEALKYVTARKWKEAIAVYQALWAELPDDLEVGLHLASVQASAYRDNDALVTIGALRHLRKPDRDDPRIDVVEGIVRHDGGDPTAALPLLDRAIAKGTASGARLLVAQARIRRSWSLLMLNRQPEAIVELESARRVYSEAGDLRGIAATASALGNAAFQSGNGAEAEKQWTAALKLREQIGFRSGVASMLGNLAFLDDDRCDFDRSEKSYGEILTIGRELGDTELIAGLLGNLANCLEMRGELTAALAREQEAQPVALDSDSALIRSAARESLVRVMIDRGDLAAAQSELAADIADARKLVLPHSPAGQLTTLASIAIERGEFAAAGASLDEAVALASGRDVVNEDARLALVRAGLARAEHRLADAEELARAGVALAQRASSLSRRSEAKLALAGILFERGRLAEARAALAEMPPACANLFQLRIEKAVLAAELDAAEGHRSDAERSLDQAIAEATKAGWPSLIFEGRLARVRIERASLPAKARVHARALAEEARAKGFIRIATLAAALER